MMNLIPAGNRTSFDCLQCPKGGQCAGGILPPASTQGYIATRDISTFASCSPPQSCRWDPSHPSTAAEAPSDHDTNPFCSHGYKGVTCGVCDTGYRRVSLECIPCPPTPWLPIVIVLVLGTILLLATLWLVRKYKLTDRVRDVKESLPIDMGVVGMAITLVQTIGSYKNINLKWSPLVKSTISVTSSLNFNLDIVSPGCAGNIRGLAFLVIREYKIVIYSCECICIRMWLSL
jgi:hypothetical protein